MTPAVRAGQPGDRASCDDPAVHIEFTHSRSQAYFRAQLARGASERTQFSRTVAQLLIAGGVAVPVVMHGDGRSVRIGVLVGLLGVLVLAATLWRRHRMVTVHPDRCAERVWLLTDDVLESRSENTIVRTSWSVLKVAQVRAEAYLLMSSTGTIVDIPRAPLTREQDAEVGAFVAGLPLEGTGLEGTGPEDSGLEGTGEVALPALTGGLEYVSRQADRPVGARLESMITRTVHRRMLPTALGGLAVLAVGLAVKNVLDSPFPLLVAVLVTIPLLVGLARDQFRPRRRHVPDGPERRITVTDEEIQDDAAGRSIRWRWTIVDGVETWPETYVLRARGGAPLTLPRDTLTAEQEEELQRLIGRRSEASASTSYIRASDRSK